MVSVDAKEFVTRVAELDPQMFERMVHDALSHSGRFSNVMANVRIGTFSADVTAEENLEAGTRLVAFEIKHRRAVDVDMVRAFVGIREALRRTVPRLDLVAVVSGLLTNVSRREAQVANLEIWDGATLASIVPEEVKERYLGYVAPDRRSATVGVPKGSVLISALANVPVGPTSWGDYQRLIAQVVEYLFSPPLKDMSVESPDQDRRNRRDIVLANPASDDFWYRMRTDYQAHYVVVDAKNYQKALTKRPVLDVAHYLKGYGAGLFAMIICREGAGPAAMHAMREQWIAGHKMIVALSDRDVIDMLQMRDAGGRPEEVIRKAIDSFRLSL